MTDLTTACERVRKVARDIVRITLANGFVPNTWERIPGRLMLVVTELDEMIDEAHPGEELADATLRLLNILESLFPRWNWIEGKSVTDVYGPVHFETWPIVKYMCKAIKMWRMGDPHETQAMLELAVCECFRLADIYDVDLVSEMEAKVQIVQARPYLHGSREAL